VSGHVSGGSTVVCSALGRLHNPANQITPNKRASEFGLVMCRLGSGPGRLKAVAWVQFSTAQAFEMLGPSPSHG